MTIEPDPIGGDDEMSTSDVTQTVRATSLPPRPTATAPPPTKQQGPATITAELPAYRPPNSTRPARSRYADPRPRRRTRRRDPAPIAIQILVWLLAVICALAVIALVTVRVHPSWLSFLRSAPPPTTSSAGQPSSPSSDSTSGSMTLVSTTPRAITYNVPIRTFSIVVHPITDSYVEVHSPSTSHSFAYAEVVHKAAKPTALSVTGSASIEIFRQASLLEITSGSHVIGTIKTPKDNTSYVFIAPKG